MRRRGSVPWWISLRPTRWWIDIKNKSPELTEDEWIEWRTAEIQTYEIEKAAEQASREEAAAALLRLQQHQLYTEEPQRGVGGGPWPFDHRRALSEKNYRGFIAQSLRGFNEELYGVGEDHKRFPKKWLIATSDLYEQVLDELARIAGHGEVWRRERGVFAPNANIREGLRKRK